MGYNRFTTENTEFAEKKAGDGLVEEMVFSAKDAKGSKKRETQKMFAKFARFATFAFKKPGMALQAEFSSPPSLTF